MLQSTVTLVVLLAGLIQCSQGSGEVVSYTVAEDLAKTRNVSSICCIQGICHSLHCTLQQGNGSNNVIINITTGVVLSSVVWLMNVNNISIVAHSNPIVNLNSTGALYFKSCHNITIEGINWRRCGANISNYTSSILEMHNCSVVTVIIVLFHSLLDNHLY